ncbi:uncharacterized protein ACMZJ9_001197 [Mantella aurantiaca]
MEILLDHKSDSTRNEPWLALCLHETLLPGSPWHKVLDKVGTNFAEKVKPLLNDPKERQMIFKLLGKDFVEKHFNKYPNNPSLLYPPTISKVEYEKLEKNKQVWLLDLWTNTAKQMECYLPGDPVKLSAEMTHFVNHTFNLVEDKMNLFLALTTYSNFQNHVAKNMVSKDFSGMDNELLAWRSFSRRRPKSVESKDLSFAIDRTERSKLNKYKGIAEVQQKTPPPLNCAESEALGNTLCAVIKSNSSTMTTVCSRLNGHLLPKALRQVIWQDKLLRSEKKLKGDTIGIMEKEARERYGKMLEHRRTELKLRSATRSPISGLIENAVVEKYGSMPSMYLFATHEQIVDEASKSLNVLYVYNGTYEPYLIHWLLPLQVAFRQTPTTAEHPYELFMYLHFLIKNIFPSWLEIFAMAERVMDTLQTEDMELFTHLQRSFQRGVIFNSKDFLTDLLGQEREEALKRYAAGQKLGSIDKQSELLANPVIILRKWMGEGFVSVLDLPAVLLIWDQLFMQDWNRKVMENFCLALLMLLRDSILNADNYSAIRQVLLNDGYHLFTADIQRAWFHLQQGGQLVDIPRMNRLNNRKVHELSPRLKDKVDARDFTKILPFGVKDITLKISLSESINKSSNTWLKDFDPTAVSLKVSVYYGVTKLCSKTSSFKPVLLENMKNKKDTKKKVPTFLMQFNDKFEYESTSLSDYINHTESTEKPFLLMEVLYWANERAPQTLGWEKVDAFEREAMSTQEIWKPRELSLLLPLHLEKEPDNINEDTPGSHESTIGLTVYDPTKVSHGKIINKEEYSRKTEDHRLAPVPHFVPHNNSTFLPDSTTLQEPFDLYIDALHYIPDCATITKVSCQILNSGSTDESSIVAFPRMDSPARNPMFDFRQMLNTKEDQLHDSSCILFQVSTVDSGNIAIIGNCMLRVFNDDGKLNVGGFQLRLRTEIPSKKLNLLAPEDLQKYPAFPCCSLLVRLLPHTESTEPVPSYESGYYFTDEAKPTRSEIEIMSTFQKDTLFPMQVKNMAQQLMEKEQSQENNVVDWYKKRIGGDKSSFLYPSLNYCSIHRAVLYRQHSGLRLKIRQAFGLEMEDLYINAFARILKGDKSTQLPELPQNWGGDEKLLTRQHDFTSLQTSPRWNDPSVVLHPYLDDNSVLLIQLFGMAARYVPHNSSDERGHVISKNGQELELQPPLGWTVFSLFDSDYANSGIHSAPLFQGFPNSGFLHSLSMTSVKSAVQDALKKKQIELQKNNGSVTMEIWDGHYFDEEHYALPVVNELLTVKNIKKFLAMQASKKGKDMSMLVIESLNKKQKKLQRNSPEYQRHQQFYKEAMGEKFYNLIETALLNAGYGPL